MKLLTRKKIFPNGRFKEVCHSLASSNPHLGASTVKMNGAFHAPPLTALPGLALWVIKEGKLQVCLPSLLNLGITVIAPLGHFVPPVGDGGRGTEVCIPAGAL